MTMFTSPPVLCICGPKSSGKTTFIEQVLPPLAERGLLVAAVKLTGFRTNSSTPFTETSRLYTTGADVYRFTPHEQASRIHPSDGYNLPYSVGMLCRRYDLVLLEGQKNLPFTKVWLTSEKNTAAPVTIEGIIDTIPRTDDRVVRFLSLIDRWLGDQWLKTPVFGCIHIGGKSLRMGIQKHLIMENGKTWIERTVEIIRQVTGNVMIVGSGVLPESLRNIPHLPDIPGIPGPMAGTIAALRWAPGASILATACDLPFLSADALNWILSHRRPGVWAVVPKLKNVRNVEPLLAHYDYRTHGWFEQRAQQGYFSLARIVSSPKAITVTPPDNLANAWRNVNTWADIQLCEESPSAPGRRKRYHGN
ncbi:molybdopterin-guanine dinucleotide biosynthesis protein MobB [Candidatus Latescibacterota bacterium]